ncbi:hypothetical protein [Leptospira noguchii]|uniref:hypothetical protein n=1 Tax=Leptospira noguchii TaxID=28182 RepID=UPI0002488475|nr:hypothetical protein [Leptospira noguchii]UOG49370.1 hypothetical protein MAL00_03540 [Leptospira noguchii]
MEQSLQIPPYRVIIKNLRLLILKISGNYKNIWRMESGFDVRKNFLKIRATTILEFVLKVVICSSSHIIFTDKP